MTINATIPAGLVFVKVGGSLYDHPHLGPGLRQYLDAIESRNVIIVPGGGPFVDAVRSLQAVQGFSDEAAHNMAIQTLSGGPIVFLAALIGANWYDNLWMIEDVFKENEEILNDSRYVFLNSTGFFTVYDSRIHPVPHTWAVTTDSIAALAAKVANARLILLKSADVPPGTPWPEAAARGWVDDYFPTAVADATVPIEVVNFRRWLDDRFPDDRTA